MSETLLRTITPAELDDFRHNPIDSETLRGAEAIVAEVRDGDSLRAVAERFGDLQPGDALLLSRADLEQALSEIRAEDRALLERVASRIRAFAEAQRDALQNTEVAVPGGVAGHTVSPVDTAGCYAPGGRFPLPSTVLMTVVTARAAGVGKVIVASPKPTTMTKAAAAIAGADGLLAVGGAQAVAAMAYGVAVPRCDVIVGPGNRWVTAAKKVVFGQVGIDMLAGPSELAVLADDSADPATIAADLLAQAEHDTDALPILVATSEELIARVNGELIEQLSTLPTSNTARPALANGYAVLVRDLSEGIQVCDGIAPEHLEVLTRDADEVARRLKHYGGLFIGSGSAEVFGDYGAGPNHTLPTSGTARFTGGLSVNHFLRVRTWLRIDDADSAAGLLEDSAALGRLEGLEGHARSAERRRR